MRIIAAFIDVVSAAVDGVVTRLRETPRKLPASSIALSLAAALLISSCGGATRAGAGVAPSATSAAQRAPQKSGEARRVSRPSTTWSFTRRFFVKAPLMPLPRPANLAPFKGRPAGQGLWRAAGRRVHGVPAVYETTLLPPGGSQPAGIAWMDTHLLKARLYSGSESPGGGPYRYTAPIQQASARNLVAAFNGGFKMDAAKGGYYTEGRIIDPLRPGAASLVIYADGSVDIGAWRRDVNMTPRVVAVRQNLVPLVADGRPTPRARSANWHSWGSTCGATSCAHSVPGIEHQWRSALGVTAAGALVYVQGPALDPFQLAALLVRARVIRGMELDINPSWPIFATYDPASEHGLATPSNGRALTRTMRRRIHSSTPGGRATSSRCPRGEPCVRTRPYLAT